MKKIILGFVVFTMLYVQGVTDERTGFMWQDEKTIVKKKWKEAKAYCTGLVLYGHDDWRLPSIDALKSIVAYTKTNPSVALEIFKHTKSSWYWTSTDKGSASAWIVNFNDGTGYWYTKTSTGYVRCVRQ